MSVQILGFDPGRQSSDLLFKLGTTHFDEQGRIWKYGQAAGAQTAGETAQFNREGGWDATPMTTTTQDSKLWNLGVPHIDMTDNYYGWFFHGCGEFEMVVTDSVTALSALTTTGTAGVVGTGGTLIDGLMNIDAGVTATRVTCVAFGRLTVGVIAAFD